jgi:hypothetical protein
VTEGHDLVHDIEDHGMLEHSVVVQLAQVLDFGNTALVEFEVVLLKTKRDGLDYGVDDADHEIGMVPVDGAQQDGKQMDVAKLDFSRLREDLVKNRDNLSKLEYDI